MAKSAAKLDFTAGGPVRSATIDITPYPQSIFNRQQRYTLNTHRALCVEPAKRFLLALEW